MSRPIPLTLLVAALLLALPSAATAAGATSMRTGFLDGDFSGAQDDQASSLGEAAALGSRIVRVSTGWPGIAPRRPANPADPADPAYDWTATDAAVRETISAGLAPLLSFTQAPTWAEGPNRPGDAAILPGAWRPDTVAYGRFARAVGRRYNGTYPDPLRPGAVLPKVGAFLPWNEPNLELYLAPQWTRVKGRLQRDAPIRYRKLVTAFTQGIHAAHPAGLVVAGGMAPFGDAVAGGRRTPPAAFLRTVLCLNAKRKRVRCAGGVAPRFDVLSHHPYSVGGPFRKALNPDDVSVPDLAAKLVKPLRAAERQGVLGPNRSKRRRIWVTEISWDSRPADPNGVPERRHADWLAQSLYVLARQGVDTVTWFQIRDTPARTSTELATSNQSGVLLADGRPKLAATAFRFPLVAVRGSSRTTVWTLAPGAGPLIIERRSGSSWVTVLRRTVERGRVVTRAFTGLPRGTRLRARQGAQTSLTVAVSRPG